MTTLSNNNMHQYGSASLQKYQPVILLIGLIFVLKFKVCSFSFLFFHPVFHSLFSFLVSSVFSFKYCAAFMYYHAMPNALRDLYSEFLFARTNAIARLLSKIRFSVIV